MRAGMNKFQLLGKKEKLSLLQIVKNRVDNKPFVSVIGDFTDTSLTVFGREKKTEWKPVLFMSRQVIRLFAYLVVYREDANNWILSIRSYASEEGLRQVKARLIVRKPALTGRAKIVKVCTNLLEHGICTSNSLSSPTYSMTTDILSNKLSESEVLATSSFLRLTDSQVKGLTVDRTLFEYSVDFMTS